MFRRFLQRASAALPSACKVCHAWPTGPVCPACIAQFARRGEHCTTCALPVAANTARCMRCQRGRRALDACVAAVDYAYPWAGCVTAFKFGDEPGLAEPIAAILMRAPGASAMLARADLVLPLPLSALRLRERGYNQALELCRHLAAAKLNTRLLLRIRETAAQSHLDRAARQANVRGAFAVDPMNGAPLQGRDVVLVDDVMTSGASLHEAALQLRRAGAARVSALVFARTAEP